MAFSPLFDSSPRASSAGDNSGHRGSCVSALLRRWSRPQLRRPVAAQILRQGNEDDFGALI
jgi:hypothetical protein